VKKTGGQAQTSAGTVSRAAMPLTVYARRSGRRCAAKQLELRRAQVDEPLRNGESA
jgi:hypothetical protein